MNLQEMGARLRQERERRGMTLDEVILRTKISRTNLLAIEAGRTEDLPHPVYAKGFVKNYARLLGLDPEAYGRVLAMEYSVAEDDFGVSPTVDKPMAVPARRSRTKARKSRGQFLLLVLVVAVTLGGLLFFMLRTPGRPLLETVAPTVTEQAVPEAAPEAAPASAPEPRAAAEAAAPETVVPEVAPEAPSPTPPPAEPEPAEEASAPTLAPAPASAPTATALPSAVDYVHHLDITATDRCWVYALVDGRTEVDVTLLAGERKRLRFNESLSVKFGNAGGVDLVYDGSAVDNPAQPGQVRTFTFP